MTKDQIIELAKQAGISERHPGGYWRFAELIAEAEREECAKVCDEKAMRCEEEAQFQIDAEGIEADVSGIRSSAWLIYVCASLIRSR